MQLVPNVPRVGGVPALVSHEGPIEWRHWNLLEQFPVNPRGRTGIAHRGLLGNWGPNHAVDAIITRWNPETEHIEVLAIFKEELGVWALPGCMKANCCRSTSQHPVFKQTLDLSAYDLPVSVTAMFYKFIEKKTVAHAAMLTDELRSLFARGRVLHQGYVDDKRNSACLPSSCHRALLRT